MFLTRSQDISTHVCGNKNQKTSSHLQPYYRRQRNIFLVRCWDIFQACLVATKAAIVDKTPGHFADVFVLTKPVIFHEVLGQSRCVCGDRTRYFQSKHEVFLTLTKLPVLKRWKLNRKKQSFNLSLILIWFDLRNIESERRGDDTLLQIQ